MVRVLQPPAVRDHRRVPRIPGGLRLPRRTRAAQAAPGFRLSRPGGAPGLRAGLRHRGAAGRDRAPADRPAGPGSHRRRITARAGVVRHVGAAADGGPRRSGRAGTPDGHGRGRGTPRRPGPRRRRDAGVHPLAPGRRGRGAACQTAAGRAGRPDHATPGRGVPVGIPGRGPARRRGGAARRPSGRPGHHDSPRTGRQHHRPGRSAHRRVAGDQGVALAAGGAGRAAGRQRGRGPDRQGRPARYLPGPPPGDPASSGRGDRARPGEPVRPGPAPVRGGGRAAAHRRRTWHCSALAPARWPRICAAAPCCAAGRRAGTGPAARTRPG